MGFLGRISQTISGLFVSKQPPKPTPPKTLPLISTTPRPTGTRELPPIRTREGVRVSTARDLPPIQDISGKPLTAPVGSPEAEEQIRQANLEFREQQLAQAQRTQLTPQQQQAIVQAQQERVGFTGKVEAFEEGQPQPRETQFFVRGEETGRFVTDPTTGQQVAEVKRPSRFEFQQRGTMQSIVLGDEGGEIVESMQVEMPSIDTEDVSAPIDFAQNFIGQQSIEERRQLPILERLEQVYESAPGEPFSIRGGIRVYEELIGIGLEKTGALKLIPEESFLKKPTKSIVFEEIAISAALLGGTIGTTAQVERQILEVGRVNLAGITQRVGEKGVITQALFRVERAGKAIKGAITSKSIVSVKDDVTRVITAATGRTISRSVVFPTAKEVMRKGKVFKAIQFSQVAQKGKVFVSASFGVTKTGAEKILFRSAGFGIRKKDVITQIGAIETAKGGVVSLGFLKVKPSDLSKIFKTTIGKQVTAPSVPLKAIGVQETKAAVSSVVQIPPTQPLKFLPIVKPAQQPIPKTKLETFPMQQFIPKQKVFTRLFQQPQVKTRQAVRQRQPTSLVLLQAQPLRQPLATIQKLAQKPIQKARVTQRFLIPFKTTPRFGVFTPIIPRPPITKPKPFGLVKFRRPPKPKKISDVYSVAVRRRGKFRTIGVGLTEKQALKLGESVTQRGLGQTFKVIGKRGITPSGIPRGFYPKYEAKEGLLFIEKPKSKINLPSEKLLLALARKLKGGRR